jgi:hypothetical protein
VAFITDALMVAAFTIRVIGLRTSEEEQALAWQLRSFQVLSFVGPLIWSVSLSFLKHTKK